MKRAPPPRDWFLRAVVLIVGGWLFSMAYALFACVVALFTPPRRMNDVRPRLLASWGRGMLRLSGVRLEVEGRERLLGDGPRVVTFNHESVLDAYAVCTLLPPGGTITIKRELLFYPVVGLAAWLIGLVPIDRGHRARSHRTLQHVARRMQKERLAVFLAPEGTRTRDGTLRPFKKGAVHLALAADAPLIPLVLEGGYELQPRRQWWARPGVLRVRVLPPMDTHGLGREALAPETRRLREVYLGELSTVPTPSA